MLKRERITLVAVIVLALILVGLIIYNATRDSSDQVSDPRDRFVGSEIQASLDQGLCNDTELEEILDRVASSDEDKPYLHLANCYIYREQYDQALVTYKDAVSYYGSIGDTRNLQDAENGINAIETLQERESGNLQLTDEPFEPRALGEPDYDGEGGEPLIDESAETDPPGDDE